MSRAQARKLNGKIWSYIRCLFGHYYDPLPNLLIFSGLCNEGHHDNPKILQIMYDRNPG